MFTFSGYIADIKCITAEQIMELVQCSLTIPGCGVSLTAKGGKNQQHGTVADNHVASPYKILRLHRKLKAGFLLQFYEPVGLGKQDLFIFPFPCGSTGVSRIRKQT